MNDEALDELERQIHEAIRFHREQYEKAVKPLIDKLVQLQSFRPRQVLVSRDQLASFGIDPFGPAPTLPPTGSGEVK